MWLISDSKADLLSLSKAQDERLEYANWNQYKT